MKHLSELSSPAQIYTKALHSIDNGKDLKTSGSANCSVYPSRASMDYSSF